MRITMQKTEKCCCFSVIWTQVQKCMWKTGEKIHLLIDCISPKNV